MTDEQRVFTEIRRLAVQLFGESKVYDYTPPQDASYPMIMIGEQFAQNNRVHKKDLNINTQVTVHFWHDNVRQRGTFSGMIARMEDALINEYGVRGEDISIQMLNDNSTAITLLHGILEVNIKRIKER